MIIELICEIIEFDWLKPKVILWHLEEKKSIHDNPKGFIYYKKKKSKFSTFKFEI